MQDCSRYDELLSAYLDGEVSAEEKQEIEAHLDSCADCRRYLSLLRTMQENLQQDLPAPPEKLRQGVMYKIGLEQKRKGFMFGAFGKWTVLAAMCCLAVLGAVKLGGSGIRKSADTAAPMTAVADMAETSATGSANSFAGGAMANAAEKRREEPAAAPEPLPAEEAESEELFMYTSDSAAAEEPAPAGIYDASALPGYSVGMDALDSAAAYSAVGILYELPEGYPAKNWEEQPAPFGQKRWLLSREKMDALAEAGIFDELYYGDLLADSGLIIQLTEGENQT